MAHYRRPIADRPNMPGYGISPAPVDTGEYSWDAACEKLASARNYWVATSGVDGRPHAMPVWGLWLDDAIYFSTGRGSRKGRNLAANPRVAVHLESGDDVVILEGTVEVVSDRAALARFAEEYERKYDFRPDVEKSEDAVFVLRPHTAFTWLEKEFVESAVRWRFAAG